MSEEKTPDLLDDRVAPQTPVNPFGTPIAPPKSVREIAAQPGEAMVRILVPAPGLMLTLNPPGEKVKGAPGERVEIPAGEYEVPASIGDHWYVRKVATVVGRRQPEQAEIEQAAREKARQWIDAPAKSDAAVAVDAEFTEDEMIEAAKIIKALRVKRAAAEDRGVATV